MCTGFSSIQNMTKTKAKGKTIRGWTRKRAMIRVVRRVHQILRDSKRFQRNKENTRSHELSAKSLTACGNFPWGIRRTLKPVTVNACMFGSRCKSKNDGQIYPCCKAFKVETDHACMHLALRSFVCPYPHSRLRLVGTKGKRADARLRDTENYCAGMGYVLARCASSPRSLGTALGSLDRESL